MRKFIVVLFSVGVFISLTGCVHHSVEYRSSPQVLPYDRVVIKSSPYYRNTQVYKTVITPKARYHQPKQAYHRIKKLHKKQYKRQTKNTLLRNKVIRKVIHQKEIKTRVIHDKRNFKSRHNSNYNERIKQLKKQKRFKNLKKIKRQQKRQYLKQRIKAEKHYKPRHIKEQRFSKNHPRKSIQQQKRTQREQRKNKRKNSWKNQKRLVKQ